MQLGMVGLGRMGANLVRRLMRDGHECVVYDVRPDAVRGLAGEGATGADSLAELVAKLAKPRAVWVMVPAGEITQAAVDGLAEHLKACGVSIEEGPVAKQGARGTLRSVYCRDPDGSLIEISSYEDGAR